MGTFTIKRWRCDRCGSEADQWPRTNENYSVRIDVDHGTAGGAVIQWNELCIKCNQLARELVKQLKSEPPKD